MKIPRSMFGNVIYLAVFLVLAIPCPTLRAGETNVNPTGTWKWVEPTNPDGRIPDITFVLKLQGDALTGSVIKHHGTESITNGVLKGDEVSFQTIRQTTPVGTSGGHDTNYGVRLTTTTYSGKVSGDSIKGTINLNVSGGVWSSSQDWEIKRVKQ